MIVRPYSSLLGLQAIGFVLAIVFAVLVGATVAPVDFARFSQVWSVVQVVSAVFLSWPNHALLRFGREEFTTTGGLGTTTATRLVLHLVMNIVVIAAVVVLQERLTELLHLPAGAAFAIVTGITVISLAECGGYVAQVTERFSAYGWSPLVQKAMQIATVAALAGGIISGWEGLIAGTLIGSAAGGLIAWGQVPRQALRPFRPRWAALRSLLGYSWAQPIGSAAGVLVAWMDLWFLERLTNTTTTGVYAWAYTVSLVAAAAFLPLSSILSPRLIDASVQSNADMQRRYLRATTGLIALAASAIPLALAALVALFWLIEAGPYAAALPPLLFLVSAIVFQFASSLATPLLVPQTRLMPAVVAINVLAAAVNGLGNWLLIPVLGVLGPAVATTVAFATMAVGMSKLAAGAAGHGSWDTARRTLATGGITVAIAGFAVFLPAAPAILLGVAGSGVLLLLFRRRQWLAGLHELTPAFAALPPRLARQVTGFLRWAAGSDRAFV
ncbi:MAG: hypothetical protein EXQ85_01620 [Alphaproteobacteria bacterium]|nr:hypothetical protein [Alphaproteobacteria bacterium]